MPEIVIDVEMILNFLLRLGEIPVPILMFYFFIYGGWLILLIIAGPFLKDVFLKWQYGRFAKKQNYIVLAIDIPKENEQTPKAFENIFNQLAGAHSNVWWFEEWLMGQHQQAFSFEIVSIDGYIQFLVHTNAVFRDLVEAAIYAQYPESTITEIQDYTSAGPSTFPNEEYNMWGTEFKYVKNDAYPIRVYRSFGDELTQDYKDPLAAFLEIMSRGVKGEQVWFQVIVRPANYDWGKVCKDEVAKIMGTAKPPKQSTLSTILSIPTNFISLFTEAFLGVTVGSKPPSAPTPRKLQDLTPGEADVVSAIQRKGTKIAYHTKIRLLYIAKHDVMNKPKMASSLVGAIKQFSSDDINSFMPDMVKAGTGGDYFFKSIKQKVIAERQRNLLAWYKGRSMGLAEKPILMNVEELASIYHFPLREVKVPMLNKSDLKTAEPPTNLPNLDVQEQMDQEYEVAHQAAFVPEGVTDENLTDAMDVELESFELDNDYFEKRFALNNDTDEGEE